jgi:ABC-type multidrug transport system ATPase subunit
VQPSTGTIRRGKTVRIATLAQRIGELEDHLDEPVRELLGSLRTSYTLGTGSKTQELTPAQLLERLGFSTAQLSTPVRDLSGGQQRRLQLLLILLDQPNVLILDEPTNDLDTDMLAVIEDLLDSWPGTLIVVSHDRYFLERVTDQQYAILRHQLRHLPGGVDEYLRLRAAESAAGISRTPASVGSTTLASKPASAGTAAANGATAATAETTPALSGAALRDAQKEVAAVERRMAKLTGQINDAKNALATHDHSDYHGLTKRMKEIAALEADVEALEERWFELTEALG